MDDKVKKVAEQLCDAANRLPPEAQDKLLAFALGMVVMSELKQPA